MTTIHAKGISRRGWLRWTMILGAAAALPGRVWAAVARPEAAFGATALDEALSKRLGADVLAKFRSTFLSALSSDSLKKGTKIYFGCKAEAFPN